MKEGKFWIDGPRVTTTLRDHLVASRGFDTQSPWIQPVWPDQLHDPYLLPDMDKGVERIYRAVTANEVIGIVGDYDMDGTPGAALLSQFLVELGATVHVVLPTREDGYGFSTAFVERLAQKNVSLILTVDCGIRDLDAVALAKSRGIDVIITDHHECPEVLPAAFAVINPKRPDSTYPFGELCGTGVVFKLIQAMLLRQPAQSKKSIPEHWLAWSLDLVALATLGDMVPLVDENRLLVLYGLKVLKRGGRLGLRRLMETIECDFDSLTYRDVTFKIIPKLNAVGRMQDMQSVLTLLTSTDRQTVDAAIQTIMVAQTQSQLATERMLLEARRLAAEQKTPWLVLADTSWHPGVTGIVAGRLAEEFGRPTIVLAGVPEGFRGSARGFGGVDIVQALTAAEEHIVKFGGHREAAGLTVAPDRVSKLHEVLRTDVPSEDFPQKVTDGTLTSEAITLEAIDDFLILSPWGVGNQEPLWSIIDARVEQVRWLSGDKHAKLLLRGYPNLDVMLFDAQPAKPLLDGAVDLHGTLSINEFRGRRTPQLIIKGIAKHGNEGL